MANQNIVTYIRATRQSGVGDEQIRAELLKVGWLPNDILEAFVSINESEKKQSVLTKTPATEATSLSIQAIAQTHSKISVVIAVVVVCALVAIIGVALQVSKYRDQTLSAMQQASSTSQSSATSKEISKKIYVPVIPSFDLVSGKIALIPSQFGEINSYEGIRDNNVVFTSDGRNVMASYRPRGGQDPEEPNAKYATYYLLLNDELNKYANVYGPVLSLDGSRYAFQVMNRQDGKSHALIDGNIGPAYDAIGETDQMVFSPDGKHFAYKAKKAGKEFIVLDGEEEQHYDGIEGFSITFSPDGKQLAYWAKGSEGWFMVINGKQLGPYVVNEMGLEYPVEFSPGSAHSAFRATRADGKMIIVHDGKEGNPYDLIASDIVFSPDGSVLAYRTEKDGKSLMVINGIEGLKYSKDSVDSIYFAPTGEKFAYRVQKENDKGAMVVDGKEEKTFNTVSVPVFSQDGKQVAYTAIIETTNKTAGSVATKNARMVVVINGNEGPEYNMVSGIVFGTDGSHYAYTAQKSNGVLIVVDGEESPMYDEVSNLTFSPDGKNIVYTARRASEKLLIKNGGETKIQADKVRSILFSPNSERMAYVGLRGKKVFVALDGSEGKEYDSVEYLAFSPASRHLVYVAQVEQQLNVWKSIIVVDNKSEKIYDAIYLFPSPRTRKESPGNFPKQVYFSADESLIMHGARIGKDVFRIVERTP